MSVSETIKKKLVEAFEPTKLDVIDESHLHAGHVGARPEGETHFRLIISSDVTTFTVPFGPPCQKNWKAF